jgi:perosamine synthetase
MDPVQRLCREHGITIVEDSAESHTVRYKERVCGSFGLVSTFSFYANKAITCGEGGMVVTDDDALATRLRSLRNLAFLPPPGPRFVHETIGWNARMSAIQAALGKSQLRRMYDVTAEKRRIGLAYSEILGRHPLLQMQPESTSYSENKFWVVGLVLDDRFNAREVALRIRERGIDSRPFFYPLHRQPLLAAYSLSDQPSLPVSERLGAQGIYLPSFVGMTDSQILQCADTLTSVLKDY